MVPFGSVLEGKDGGMEHLFTTSINLNLTQIGGGRQKHLYSNYYTKEPTNDDTKKLYTPFSTLTKIWIK